MAMVDSVRMLSLDDNRWNNLTGGYRVKCDPRPLLARLESDQNKETAWHELWEELHHQGDVGDASYASVPHLVRIHRQGDLRCVENLCDCGRHRTRSWERQPPRSAGVVGRGLSSGDSRTSGNWYRRDFAY